jgi:hypothetical protein
MSTWERFLTPLSAAGDGIFARRPWDRLEVVDEGLPTGAVRYQIRRQWAMSGLSVLSVTWLRTVMLAAVKRSVAALLALEDACPRLDGLWRLL